MLYQQGTQRIEIIVRKDSGTAQNGAKEVDTENVSATGSENVNQSISGGGNGGMTSRQKRFIKTNTTHALAVAHQVMDLGIEYYVSGIGQRQGDQALQELASREVEKVTDVTNFASSVAMGITYGSYAGPAGAIFGGLFGAISSSASIGSKYMGRVRDFNYKIFKENNAIEYQRARASISLTTGRLR